MSKIIPASREDWHLKVCVVLLAFVTWMSLNIAVPAFADIGSALHVTKSILKETLSIALLGFAILQIPFGVASDRFGRRPVLIFSLLGSLVASTILCFSTNIIMFMLGMLILGLSLAAIPVLVFAPLVDRFTKNTIVKVYSWIAIAMTVAPFAAFYLGAEVDHFFGWHYVFAFLFMIILATLLLSSKWFHETKNKRSSKIDYRQLLKSLRMIISMREFWRFTLIYSLIGGYMIAYYASLTFWYYYQFHMCLLDVSWMALPPIVAFIVGSNLTNWFVGRISAENLIKYSCIALVFVAIIPFFLGLFFHPTAILVVSIVSLFFLISGSIVPLSNSILAHKLRSHIAILPGFISGMRCVMAAVLVPIIGAVTFHTFLPLAIVTFAVALIVVVAYFVLATRPKSTH